MEENKKTNKRHIPSYYNYSRVNDDYSIPKNEALFHENLMTDFDSVKHIRIMKRFDTPDYPYSNDKEKAFLDDTSQKDFFVRCYLPKKKISHKIPENRIGHAIIMFNGLNECERYDLYDILGAQFAEAGFATILLPTPFHLNRRIDRSETSDLRSMESKHKKTFEYPTDIAYEDARLYYYSFKRSLYELEHLIKRIKDPQDGIKDPKLDDYGFFNNYFVPNPKITLFGFSLGGLKAMAGFLKNINSCHSVITFNTAHDITKVNLESLGLNTEKWDVTMDELSEFISDGQFQSDEEKLMKNLFDCLYLGRKKKNITTLLNNNVKKYFAIKSGGDQITKHSKSEYLLPEGVLSWTVPIVGHIPTLDLRWDSWLTMAGEQVIYFIRNIDEIHWSHQELESQIEELIKDTEYFKTEILSKSKSEILDTDFSLERFKTLREQVNDPEKFMELYYVSKVFYPKFAELLAKFGKG